MGESRPIREFWWEGQDFHVVYQDTGEEVVFRNAWVQDHQQPDPDPNIATVDKLVYSADSPGGQRE